MSLLLDALKEAEARKREAGAATTPAREPVEAPSFEIDGALALAEDVVAGPDIEGGAGGAAASVARAASTPGLRGFAARATAGRRGACGGRAGVSGHGDRGHRAARRRGS